MQKLKQKLKSQIGASITFALLLFLVCAVVGSAVLVAGTAAAGRMSKIAEMDQRYYAVNSAARLLVDQVAGDKNTVTITKRDSKETPSADSTFYLLDNETGGESPIGSDSSLSISQDAAYRLAKEETTSPKELSLTVSSGDNAPDLDRLNVNIEETIDADGGLTLLIKSKEDTTKKNGQYSLELKFNLAKSEVVDETDKQRTTTYKYTWNIRDLRVVGSQRWQDA